MLLRWACIDILSDLVFLRFLVDLDSRPCHTVYYGLILLRSRSSACAVSRFAYAPNHTPVSIFHRVYWAIETFLADKSLQFS